MQDIRNAQNKIFVDAYKKKYGAIPGVFAERGWIAARVVVEALKKTRGTVTDKPALLTALRGVNFLAPRGLSTFDPATQNVINPVYVRQVVKSPDGLVNTLRVFLGAFTDPGK